MKKATRDFIYKRDKVCRICGSKENKTIHHLFPKGHPKRELKENMTLLCRECHDHINLIWNPESKKKTGYAGFLEDEETKQSYLKD